MGLNEQVKYFPTIDTIISSNLTELLMESEQLIFISLQEGDYETCELVLTEFCKNLLDLTEDKQVHVARIFFTSIVVDIVKSQARKKYLHPVSLFEAYKIIYEMENWQTITEYLLYIPDFMSLLKTGKLLYYTYSTDNPLVDHALTLIRTHLKNSKLSVNWLAEELNITTTHLSNQFKLHIGEKISTFISTLKVNEIAYEIVYTNHSIKKIYKEYGFTNYSNFIQFFKKHKGLTPSQYMKENLNY